MMEGSNKRPRRDEILHDASVSVDDEEKLVLTEEDFSVQHKPLVRHALLPPKTDTNLRFIERIGTYFYPTASFVYEVIYTSQHRELGFSYQWQYLPYSARSPNRFMLYCVVSAVPANYTQVIAVGDIIVKVNEDPFFYLPGDSVDYASLQNRLSHFVATAKSAASTTIRFYRPGGADYSSLPSVMEIKLTAQEKSIPVIAKFIVKTNNKGEQYVENTSMENTIPSIAKKMLTGSKIAWQNIPILDAGPATALSNVTTLNNLAFASNIGVGANLLATVPENLNDVTKNTVFKDRQNKFHAVFVDEDVEPIVNPANGQLVYQTYYLGRYEREDEANKVLQRALQVRETSGKFNIKHYLLNYKEPEPVPEAKREEPSTSSSSEITYGFSLSIPGIK